MKTALLPHILQTMLSDPSVGESRRQMHFHIIVELYAGVLHLCVQKNRGMWNLIKQKYHGLLYPPAAQNVPGVG